jgi:hypothetical protein
VLPHPLQLGWSEFPGDSPCLSLFHFITLGKPLRSQNYSSYRIR